MARHHNISTAESGLASLTEDAGNVLDSRELLAKRGLFPRARECGRVDSRAEVEVTAGSVDRQISLESCR